LENAQIADIFNEIADLLDIKQANTFRVRSYRNAARTIRDLPDRIEDLAEQDEDLSDIPNIGESTAEKIHEILDRGSCKRLDDLRKETPADLTQIMKIPSLGPRKALQFHEQLGVDSIEELKEACENHEVRELEGMGAKTEENILEGIKTFESTQGRALYSDAEDRVESLRRHLDDIDAIDEWEVAGSFRRCKETVGDLDILVRAGDRKKATKRILEYSGIADVIGRGKEKVSVRLGDGLQVDFRFFESGSFGAALLYFTGSKAHGIALRRRAQERDWKLNEYGIFKGKKRLAGKTEEALYHRLNLAYIPPELREDRGEMEAADEDALPELVELDDVRGDLQCHTTASDGADSIEDMAKAARERGYRFLAITDHSKAVRVTQGLDDDAARKHADAIRKVDGTFDDFWLLAGVEVDILKRGRLDLKEKALSGLDWVIASVHSYFSLSKKEMTDRLLAAVKTGVIHAIAHPTSRMMGKRESIAFDREKVFEACRDHKVFLEINGQPDRLDLPDTYCRQALDAGVTFTFGTDAHKATSLDFMRYCVNVARRGWLEKTNVVNSLTRRQLKKRIKRD